VVSINPRRGASPATAQLCEALCSSGQRLIHCCIQQDPRLADYCLGELDGALGATNAANWRWVLKLICSLVKETGAELAAGTQLSKVLKALALLRDRDECFCKAEIEEVGGVICQAYLPSSSSPPFATSACRRCWRPPLSD